MKKFALTICQDGTTLSIQASESHYCSPRRGDFDHWDQYSEVEVGFPKNAKGEAITIPAFAPYADGPEEHGIYAYVPIDLVREFIAEHGGARG